jgi:tol-pal system protein YbgF
MADMIYPHRVTAFATAGFLLVLAIALVQPVRPASAQSVELNEVRNELARLQREVSALRRQIARSGNGGRGAPKSIGGELPPTLAARMEVRLSQLERQVSGMTGKIEEIDHGIKVLGEKLDKAMSDVELRLSALEKGKPVAGGARRRAGDGERRTTARRGGDDGGARGGAERAGREGGGSTGGGSTGGGSTGGAEGGTSGAAAGGGEELAKLPDGKPAEQYQYAMSLLRRGQHEKAAGALKAFIQRYPNGALTGNAVYWLGESYYVRGQYREAAIHFAEGFKKFPKSPKASANLLKLGMSFGKLNKRREACASLYELRRRYPRAPTYIRRRAAGEQRRLRCG